jgi:beta-lactamase class A
MRVSKWGTILAVLILLQTGIFATPSMASASTASEQTLQTKLTNYFAGKHAKYTLSLRELGGSQHQLGIEDARQIEPASVIKLFWAWATLKKVDEGQLDLNSTLAPGFTWESCLNLMIKVSDNQCSAWIRDSLGNTVLNQQFIDFGYPNTRIVIDAAGKYVTKYTSAADISLLLQRLEQGTLLSPGSTTYFHNLLKAQAFRQRITPGVQKGVVVENKGGDLWVPGGWTQSDAAIVRGPHSTYVLVIFGRNDAKNSDISGASKIVYEHIQNQTITSANVFARRQYVTTAAVWVRKSRAGRYAYRAKRNALLELVYADGDWVKVKQNGKTAGFLRFTSLKLTPAYIWP